VCGEGYFVSTVVIKEKIIDDNLCLLKGIKKYYKLSQINKELLETKFKYLFSKYTCLEIKQW